LPPTPFWLLATTNAFAKGETQVIYELRVYHCLPGRLPALLKRFETATVRLFEKHGIRQLGFWTVAVGESNQDLVYILQWESMADRDKRFAAFQADPEWIEARRKSEEDGPLLASISNSILTPTSFSAAK
jgi:NIPSNAP